MNTHAVERNVKTQRKTQRETQRKNRTQKHNVKTTFIVVLLRCVSVFVASHCFTLRFCVVFVCVVAFHCFTLCVYVVFACLSPSIVLRFICTLCVCRAPLFYVVFLRCVVCRLPLFYVVFLRCVFLAHSIVLRCVFTLCFCVVFFVWLRISFGRFVITVAVSQRGGKLI